MPAAKRKRLPRLWVVVCRDGTLHASAQERRDVQSAYGRRLDENYFITCGPHRVVAYVPKERR